MGSLTTYEVADVSTAHITVDDNGYLEKCAASTEGHLIVYAKDHGYFVFCAIEDDSIWQDLIDDGVSLALVDLLRMAKAQGCKWVELDADGETYEELMEFEW